MAAMTVEETTRVSANNKQQMASLLASQQEARTWRDRIVSAPKALRGWLNSVITWMRLDRAKDGFIAAYNRGQELMVRVTGPFREVGLFNILGALLTCRGGRDIIRNTGLAAYRVVSAPVRFVGRVFGWIGRHIGLNKAVDWVDAKYHQGVDWVAGKLEAGLQWLDEREHSGAMRWARPYFQGAVVGRLIRAYAPTNLRTPLYIANLFVPTFGVGKRDAKGLTTESKLEVVRDAAETAKASVEDRAGEAIKKDADVVQMPLAEESEVIEKFEDAVRVGSGKKARFQRVTKSDGTVIYRLDGRDYTLTEIPSHITHEAITAAIADTNPNPPEMNRAARRAAEKAASKSS